MIDPIITWTALPDKPLVPGGAIVAAFCAVGAQTYRDAAHLVYRLPYGRTSSQDNLTAALTESRGTCSTKHALLAQLAIEQRLPVALMLGIYLMNERNTPGVGALLGHHGLVEIPEAHCYLMCRFSRIDVTREHALRAAPIAALLHEEEIAPAQISLYKIQTHQEFLRDWLVTARLTKTPDELWQVREDAALAVGADPAHASLAKPVEQ